MGGKQVIPCDEMVHKIKAAVRARSDRDKLFILARTDALETDGIDEAMRRGEKYLKAGADGIYIEGPHNVSQLRKIGRAFRGDPLAVTMLEGGGKTPILPPHELRSLGFNMILYPTSVLFRVTRTMLQALRDIKEGRPMPVSEAVSMMEFEKLVDIAYWKSVEQKRMPLGERVRQGINEIFKLTA
jgi:2-methylisocitrate lyase-like PEP mutase family enzyme